MPLWPAGFQHTFHKAVCCSALPGAGMWGTLPPQGRCRCMQTPAAPQRCRPSAQTQNWRPTSIGCGSGLRQGPRRHRCAAKDHYACQALRYQAGRDWSRALHDTGKACTTCVCLRLSWVESRGSAVRNPPVRDNPLRSGAYPHC